MIIDGATRFSEVLICGCDTPHRAQDRRSGGCFGPIGEVDRGDPGRRGGCTIGLRLLVGGNFLLGCPHGCGVNAELVWGAPTPFLLPPLAWGRQQALAGALLGSTVTPMSVGTLVAQGTRWLVGTVTPTRVGETLSDLVHLVLL